MHHEQSLKTVSHVLILISPTPFNLMSKFHILKSSGSYKPIDNNIIAGSKWLKPGGFCAFHMPSYAWGLQKQQSICE